MKKKDLSSALFLYRYCGWISRWHRGILFVSLLTTIVGLCYSIKLYKNLKTDIEDLLPESAESVRDLKAASKRLTGINHLSVVVESTDRQAGRRFVKDAAERLRKLPSTLVERVQYDVQVEREFFSKNRPLYIDLTDWEQIEKYTRDRLGYERKANNPFSLGLEDHVGQKPELNFEELKAKYTSRTKQFDRFQDGFFESADGETHVILVFLPGKATDIEVNKKLSAAAHQIVFELEPKSYAKDLVVGFDGDVQNVVEAHESIVEDLIKSSLIVAFCVGLVLLLYFPSFCGVVALCASLICGTAMTFGLSYFLVGYLNANTAFLGSIVVGNGINFGVIVLARYFEEKRRIALRRQYTEKKRTHEVLLRRSIGYTAQATWTAALAAGSAYASLTITDFRGFSQFGIIGGLGMLICWLSAFTTLPALLIWMEKHHWLKIKTQKHYGSMLLRQVASIVLRFHKTILAFTVVSLLASIFAVSGLSKRGFIETDFTKLRSKQSIVSGSAYWDEKVNKVFARYLTPTAILAPTKEDAQKIAETLRQVKLESGDSSVISDIKSMQDFVPEKQRQKLKIIYNIRKLLSPKVLSNLSESDRKLVRDLLGPEQNLKSIDVMDVPESLTVGFREANGALDRAVLVYPRLGRFWDANEVIQFTEKLRSAVKKSGAVGFIAGQPPVSADMITAIMKDGPKATGVAFVAVFALVIIVFPSWRLAGSVLSSLFIGVLWMTGIMAAFDLKINFLNFIALPITFGIGVDYAVNIISRYSLGNTKSVAAVIENTGGAVALCSATTIIGYSSLLIASNQAFVSFGQLAVLGELTCLSAAIIVLPVIWVLFSRKISRPSDQEQVRHGVESRV